MFPQNFDLGSDTLFLLVSELQSDVLLCAELRLLDRVLRFISDVLGTSLHLEHDGEHTFFKTVDSGVNLRQLGRVFVMESLGGVVSDLLNLLFRHEVDSLNILDGVELGLLLDHELVQGVDQNETVVGSRHNKSLIKG